MKKTIYIFTLVFLVVIILSFSIVFYINEKSEYYGGKKNAIDEVETAISIGEAILYETFPEIRTSLSKYYPNGVVEFTAQEENGIWRVQNDISTEKWEDNIIKSGGGYYVDISKKNGKILKIGIWD